MRLIDADSIPWIDLNADIPNTDIKVLITFADKVNRMPTIEPERSKGEWVGVHAYCDHMNEEANVKGKTERYLPTGIVVGVYCNQCWCRAEQRSNFCPNCGAYMRGGEGAIN